MELTVQSGKWNLLWQQGVQKAYLFFGTDDRLKQLAVQQLLQQAAPEEWRDFDMEAMHLFDTDAGRIFAAAVQAPFGAEKRVVLVRGAELWREKARQQDADKFAELLGALPASACVILVAAAGDEEAKRKTAVSAKLDAALRQHGMLAACKMPERAELVQWITAWVKQENKQIEPEAARKLMENVGADMQRLETELQKLCAYAAERQHIGLQDVLLLAPETPEDSIFAAVDAVMNRSTDNALLLLAELHRYDPHPHAVAGKYLAMLARQIRLVWQARFLIEKGLTPNDVRSLPAEILEELPSDARIVSMAFRARELFAMARLWEYADLEWALEQLMLCDLANKGGATREETIFGAAPARNLQMLVASIAVHPSSAPHRARYR